MRTSARSRSCADTTSRTARTTTSPAALPLRVSHISSSPRRYNKLCGQLRQYAHRLSILPAQDPFRARAEGALLAKLYDTGVLTAQAKLSDVERKLSVAAFCRRRLAVVLCAARMAETVSAVRALRRGRAALR
jgi:ribosomal protein S4